jgi:hypothetical protein
MSTVVIKYEGDDITDDVVFEQTMFRGIADGTTGTCSVLIDDAEHSYANGYFHAGGTLELFIDGERAWDGWVVGINRSWPLDPDDTTVIRTVPRFLRLSGQDRNILLQKRVMYRVDNPADHEGLKIWPEDTWDKTAIEYALEHYVDMSGDDITWNIDHVGTPGPYEEFTLGYVSAPMGVLFEDCSEITGAVYFIGPDRVGRYVDDMTVTAPFILSDVKGAGKVTYREVSADLDYTEAANEALVWGVGKGSDEAVFAKYTDSDSVNDHGLWQWGELYIGAWKQLTVNRRAQTYVEGSPNHRRGHNDPVPVVTCTIFEPGIRAGHVATFEMQAFGYSQALPVRSVEMTFPTPTTVKYDLELSLKIDTPYGIPNLWKTPPWEDDGPGDGEVIPPEGPGIPSLPTAETLIDHFDRTTGYWTSSGETGLGSSWSITLPDVPGGFQTDDLIVVNWTHTAIPGGWGASGWPTDPDTPFDENSFPVYLLNGVDVWVAYLLTGYAIPGATVISRYMILTDPMRDALNSGGEIYIETDGIDEQTHVGYAVIVVRGSLGVPTTGATWGGVYHELAGPWDQIYVRSISHPYATDGNGNPGGEDYLYAAFVVAGGNHDYYGGDGSPVLGMTISGSISEPDWSVEERKWPSAVDTPSFALGVARTASDTGGNFYWDLSSGGGETWVGRDLVSMAWSVRFAGEEKQIDPTPGPEITGSDYPGGNEYDTWSWGSGTWGVADSCIYVKDALLYTTFTLSGPEVSTTDGSVVVDRPDAAWCHGRFILKARFQFGGPDTRKVHRLDLQVRGFDIGQGIGWDVECLLAYGAPDSIYPYGWDIYFDPAPDLYHDDYVSEPIPDVPPPGEDDWYYIVVDFGVSGNTQMKFWKDGEPEPGWRYTLPNKQYLLAGDDWGTWAGYGTATNQLVLGLTNYMYPSANSSVLRLDAIWAVDETNILSGIVIEAPVMDTTEDAETGSYHTKYPYVPGTLAVYFQGVRLRAGVDYIETDPATGAFRVLDERDLSGGLYVTYRRAGSTSGSTGEVYRPAPVMQRGWGTALDGYNCMMACSVMALDRHTLGAFTPYRGDPRSTPPSHRSHQDDQVTGADLSDIATAWRRGWDQDFYVVGTTTFGHFTDLLNEGRGAIVAGLYSSLPASKRYSDFTGPHGIYVNEQFENGNFWVCDPLYRFPVIYTYSELWSYAASLAGSGNIIVGFTRVT